VAPERPAGSITADELSAWFMRTRDAYAPATWNRDQVIVRSFVRILQAQGAALDLPAIGYRRLGPVRTRALSCAEVAGILGLPVPLREKTLWTLVYESAARTSELLGLDVGDLDLANRRGVVTGKGGAREWVAWSTSTARLLPRLLKGRRERPVFTTRAPSRVVVAVLAQAPDGTARLSYRRAEELFKAATGSTLHQLRHSALDAPGGGWRVGADVDDQAGTGQSPAWRAVPARRLRRCNASRRSATPSAGGNARIKQRPRADYCCGHRHPRDPASSRPLGVHPGPDRRPLGVLLDDRAADSGDVFEFLLGYAAGRISTLYPTPPALQD
jgi:integrase